MLYRLLNHNRTPFLPLPPQNVKYSDRETAQIRRMRGDAIPSIPDISPVLNKIVLKACAFQAQARYQSAKEMREALESVLKNGLGNQKTVVSPSETERPLPTADRPKHGSIRFSNGTEIDVEQRMREKSFVPNTPSVRSQAQKPLPAPKQPQTIANQGGTPVPTPLPAQMQMVAPKKNNGVALLVISIVLILLSALLCYYVSIIGGLILFVASIVLMVYSINKIRHSSS